MPTEFIRRNIERVNRKGLPVFIYLHPREIDVESPRLNLGLVNRFIHYYNIANTRDKLSGVMKGHKFILMKDYSVFDVARNSNKKSDAPNIGLSRCSPNAGAAVGAVRVWSSDLRHVWTRNRPTYLCPTQSLLDLTNLVNPAPLDLKGLPLSVRLRATS